MLLAMPVLGKKPIRMIKRREIINLLETVMDEHGPWMMTHLRRHLDLAWQYWLGKEWVDNNPVAGLGDGQQF